MQTGIVFDIQHNSFVDGPGIRTSVFMKGCNLRCSWCHNPESQKPQPELMFFENRCTHCGKCREVCPQDLKGCVLCGWCEHYCLKDARKLCGRAVTVSDILDEIMKDRIFYSASGGGATFSGGECMLQLDFLRELLIRCKQEEIHTAVDTAGNVPYGHFETILPWTDMILYDVKSMLTEKHKAYTGCGNELILENLAGLLKQNIRIWIRVPIIPGFNDNEDEMKLLAGFLKQYGIPEKVELLPYHRMGEHKYPAIGRIAPSYEVPTDETIIRLNQILRSSL